MPGLQRPRGCPPRLSLGLLDVKTESDSMALSLDVPRRHGCRRTTQAQLFQTTLDLPDVDGAPHNEYSLLSEAGSWRAIDVPQVAALRPPIKLDRARASTHFMPPEAEHARSHGTAASAAGKSCCLMGPVVSQ